jgi:hydroxyacylglutathione hydrolase
MAALEIHRIPARKDNYLWLAREADSGAVAVVDPADAEPVIAKCAELGWRLTHILNTHHHGDHTGGNLELKARYGCTVVGSRADRARIPGIDVEVGDGDTYHFGTETAEVFDVSGHTLGHITYWFPNSQAVFVGDTIFAMGCGRLSEGTPALMWKALSRLRKLPPDTLVYCAHEYTQTNARFALTIEPSNKALQDRAKQVDEMRANGIATVPSLMSEERATNPFLRADEGSLMGAIGMAGADPVDVFAETRTRKDNF